MHRFKIVILMVIGTLVAVPASADPRIEYPNTRRGDLVETFHGVRVADPYRWLEEDIRQSKDVADWATAENKITARYLASIPEGTLLGSGRD